MRRNEDVTGWTMRQPQAIEYPKYKVEELQALCTGLLPYTPLEAARIYCELITYVTVFVSVQYWPDALLFCKFPKHAKGFIEPDMRNRICTLKHADPNRPIKYLASSTIGVTL